MSFPIAGGAVLILALGLLYVHNQEKVSKQDEGQIPQESLDPDLREKMNTAQVNNPRSDIHVDSITNALHANYAGVDPTRHKEHTKNSKDADGDSMHRTSLGQMINDLWTTNVNPREFEWQFIHQDGELNTKHRSHENEQKVPP